ncbi:pentapeptide repeat-containing protein [Micromonospora sp. DT228]|uniref:pentapeptide repeat-containing protein n=1 Tax=Micromonospora sp. DT228 TaxID=3393443 RepID=UPI003CEB3C1E
MSRAPTVQPNTSGVHRTGWLTDRIIGGVTVAVGFVGIAVLVIMLKVADAAPLDKRPELQIAAIKYGLGVMASGGAIAALLLAIRRQRLSEANHELALKAQSHTERDAAERRINELFTKAVEHLGASDAAVRLGGMYALERVAQTDPAQRQTVVDVICAYLRMPFDPVTHSGLPRRQRIPRASRGATHQTSGGDQRQELQVRQAAQRILAAHLPGGVGRSGAELHLWTEVRLNLSGAVLVDLVLDGVRLRDAAFVGATFVGSADFSRATFRGDVSFRGATFEAEVTFEDAVFENDSDFVDASFNKEVDFTRSKFMANASFRLAKFHGPARFREAEMAQATFDNARFAAPAQFGAAKFARVALFRDVEFRADARFGEVHFGKCKFLRTQFVGEAWFGHARFATSADFGGARFRGNALFIQSQFGGDALFGETKFEAETSYSNVVFMGLANFGGARFDAGLFVGARFLGQAWFVAADFIDAGVFDHAAFCGDGRFGSVSGDATRFQNTRVYVRPNRRDAWPSGWGLGEGPADTDGFRLLTRLVPAPTQSTEEDLV